MAAFWSRYPPLCKIVQIRLRCHGMQGTVFKSMSRLAVTLSHSVTAVMIVTTSNTLVITIACGKARLILYFPWCPGLRIQLPVHTNTIAQLRSVTLFGVTKQSWTIRAWIDCRVKFPPTPRWDLNSIGGPPRTRVWAGRRVTGGDLGGPAEGTWGGPSNSNMLNLRTIPLSKTEPNSEYKLRLISEKINNW